MKLAWPTALVSSLMSVFAVLLSSVSVAMLEEVEEVEERELRRQQFLLEAVDLATYEHEYAPRAACERLGRQDAPLGSSHGTSAA